MGDLVPHKQAEEAQIIESRPDLRLKRLRILLAEKETQLDNLTVTINNLKKAKIAQLELQQDICQEQIKQIREQIVGVAREIGGDTQEAIDAEFTVVDS
jgi:hypothetical protein